jgi:alkylglycerol monooxygenase
VLIVWDRLFGTFEPEDDAEPCVYGTRAPLRSWNPLWANLQNYWDLAQDAWRAERWSDKLRVWFMHPGWRPADVAARWPRPAFELARVQRFDPAVSRVSAAIGAVLFIVLLNATTLFLWNQHRMTTVQQLGAVAALLAGLWVVGALFAPRRAVAVSAEQAAA